MDFRREAEASSLRKTVVDLNCSYCRFSVQRQDHHSHPAAAGGGKASHDEGEMVAGKRLSGGGEQRRQRPRSPEHWWDLHRLGRRTRPLRLRGCWRVCLQVQTERTAGEGNFKKLHFLILCLSFKKREKIECRVTYSTVLWI